MRRARFVKFIEAHKLSSGKGKWIHVTLTVRNVPLGQLRATIQEMNRAFGRMIRRKGWPALGWIRSTEVTRAANDLSHPHLHALLFVPHSYFVRGNYINKRGWIEMWRKALRADYDPSVWIRLYKMKKVEKDGKVITLGPAEIIKYPVKGCDLIGTKKKPGLIRNGKRKDGEWLAELTRQMKGLHLIAAGGVLKSVFKDEKEDDEDLLRSGVTTREEMEELEEAWFLWRRLEKRYRLQSKYMPGKE